MGGAECLADVTGGTLHAYFFKSATASSLLVMGSGFHLDATPAGVGHPPTASRSPYNRRGRELVVCGRPVAGRRTDDQVSGGSHDGGGGRSRLTHVDTFDVKRQLSLDAASAGLGTGDCSRCT